MAREIAVIEAATGATPNTRFHLFSSVGFVAAEGSWKRIDGGGKMSPATIKIECREERGECLEASTNMSGRYVFAPQVERFEAKFAPDAVTYENDIPACAKYAVRIDLQLKKVFAVRDRKEAVTNPMCANLEDRIELQLGDGYSASDDPLADHFVPLLSGITAIF